MKKVIDVGLQSAEPIDIVNELILNSTELPDTKNQKVREISLTDIDDHPQHPFQVRVDDAMYSLSDNIKEYGIKSPALVRQMENGRYQLISGHRRRKACELAGKTTMPVIVHELDDDEAAIALVDSNLLQRKTILPSEKAKSYKMWLDALKRQAGRPSKDNASRVGTNFRSDEELAKMTGDGRSQIRRIIDLLKLIPQFLDMMDNDDMPMAVAEELIHLPTEEQKTVYVVLGASEHRLDTTKAKELRQASKAKQLDHKEVELILSGAKESKPQSMTARLKPKAVSKIVSKYFKPEQKSDEIEAVITAALDYYYAHQAHEGGEDS